MPSELRKYELNQIENETLIEKKINHKTRPKLKKTFKKNNLLYNEIFHKSMKISQEEQAYAKRFLNDIKKLEPEIQVEVLAILSREEKILLFKYINFAKILKATNKKEKLKLAELEIGNEELAFNNMIDEIVEKIKDDI